MKLKTKIIAIALCATLAIGGVVGGSLAYFTDVDGEANIFTTGGVDIDLTEDFQQGATLIPGVDITKAVEITNTGKSDAYVWYTVAVPSGLGLHMGSDEDANHNHKGAIDVDFGDNFDTDWEEVAVRQVLNTKDQLYYDVHTFVFKGILSVGDTVKGMRGVKLHEHIDIDSATGTWRHVEEGTATDLPWSSNEEGDPVIYVSAYAIQTEGIAADGEKAAHIVAYETYKGQWDDGMSTEIAEDVHFADQAKTVEASTQEELNAALAEAANGPVLIMLDEGEYTTNTKIPGGSNVTITGAGEGTVLSGQIATTASNAGTVTLNNLTVKVDSSIVDSTGISQTSKSAIALWGDQTVVCNNVTFNMSLADSTAITSWWDTGKGTSIVVRNCTFNCNGQRPIRATGNVTVENCTFNDPYRYAVQLTAKASTATELDKAIINFNNNTIVDGPSGKALVYGIQLEGETYGCQDCVINGAGNTIVDGGAGSAMYYCEGGKVVEDTIEWNTEVVPVHDHAMG